MTTTKGYDMCVCVSMYACTVPSDTYTQETLMNDDDDDDDEV